METYLFIFQTVISILLAFVILVQNRGSGLSGAILGGSGGNFYSSKRGVEKLLARLTIVLAILFVGNAILYMFLPQLT